MRWVEMQDWPAYVNPPAAQRAAAQARSASAATITAALPPNSRATRFVPALARIAHPALALPVNVMSRTRGSSIRIWATSTWHGTTLMPPAGYPEAITSSASRSVVSGSCGGGFRVRVAPQAIAGAILWAARSTGKLNGVIAAIGDSGKRRVMAIRPAPAGTESAGSISPEMRVASSAASRNTKTARSSSRRACAIGFPASSARVRARSSRSAARPSATLRSAAARSYAGIVRHARTAATFASSAARTSAGPARVTTPTSLLSYGAVMIIGSIGEQTAQRALGFGEGLLEMLQIPAEPEPQERWAAELIAGAEQHAVLRAGLLDDFACRDRLTVARPANRARLRRLPAERVAEALQPRLHHRIVAVQDAAGALDQLLAHAGVERDGRKMIGRA